MRNENNKIAKRVEKCEVGGNVFKEVHAEARRRKERRGNKGGKQK